MSRAGYADFFPAAPSVLAEKEKKAQAEKKDRRARNVPDDYGREPNALSVPELGNIASSSCTPISIGVPLSSGHLVTAPTLTPTTTSSSPPPPLPSPSTGPASKGYPSPQKLATQSASTRETYPLPPPPIPPPPPAPLTPKGTPPAIKSDPARRNWRVKYDPFLEKKGVPKKSKEPILRWDGEGITIPVTDPRLEIERYTDGPKIGKKRLRPGLYRTRWKWDENYIGPGPPSQILITGLSPLTTETEISMHFRPHGDIQTLEIKIDPATGGSLGICSIVYRDGPRSRSPAHEAAKKATHQGNGSRIGMQRVRVELDRDGLKCKKLTGRIIEDKRRKEAEAEKSRPRPLVKPSYDESRSRPRSPNARTNSPSRRDPRTDARSDNQNNDRSRDQHPTLPQRPENYRALDHVGKLPYIFITSRCIPGDERYVRHLNGRLKNFGLKDIFWDRTGFYVVFWERRDMERCFKVCDGDRLFSYTMLMEKHIGSHRSPSPPPAPVSRPEPKKMGPSELISEATNALMKDMKSVLMRDLKKRLAAPTIYDSLESGRLTKRRKMEEEEPKASTANSRQVPDMSLRETSISSPAALLPPSALKSTEKLTSVVTKSILPKPTALPRFKKRIIVKADDSSTPGASPLLNGTRAKLSKADARPLAHRLNQCNSDAGSDDESTITENRPVSRGSRALSLDIGDDDSVSVTPSANEGYLKRKRSVGPTSKLRDTAVSTDDEGQHPDGGDGAQSGHDLKKPRIGQSEAYEDGEVFMEVEADEPTTATTPHLLSTSKARMVHKSKHVALESDSEGYEDEIVFPTKADSANENGVANVSDDEDDYNAVPGIEVLPKVAKSRDSRKKRKASDSGTNRNLLTVPSAEYEEDHNAEIAGMGVSWGATTEGPMATVQDDPDAILDLDGLQDLIKDAEDFKFLSQALAGVEAAELGNVQAWAFKEKQLKAAKHQNIIRSQRKIEGFYRPNLTGCARTEGYRRIPEAEKSMYLPHRLQLAAKAKSAANSSQETSPTSASNTVKNPASTSRMNRVNNRRLVAELNNQKQMLSSDADVMRFNQLKKRKKPVKFARSAIHNWGLYAMENISAGDMIIEYVGEIIRQQVADMREKKYLKSGIGSSYLFRIDDSTVIDATKAGGIARFINHSCTPNCTAKIIKVEGSKRIVIYALRDIRENEELTYDYKFERELDSEERIPCLCGSSGCKGFLN